MSARDESMPRPAKPSLKQRLSTLFDAYGPIAIVTYLALSVLTILAFSIAIWAGLKPSTETGVLGVILAGWVLAKTTVPLRILATLALTPGVAVIVARFRRTPTPAPVDAAEPGARDADAQ